MPNGFQHAAGSFINPKDAERLSGKKDEIEKLANSSDGQKVKEMLSSSGTDLQDAMEKGDMETLRGAVSNILKTDAGARLYKQLTDMMK